MKAELATKKDSLDERNVALQSLVYEKNNLLSEIEECKTFVPSQLAKIGSFPSSASSQPAAHDSIVATLTQELAVDAIAPDRRNADNSISSTRTCPKAMPANKPNSTSSNSNTTNTLRC
jgi:hypothetical protein